MDFNLSEKQVRLRDSTRSMLERAFSTQLMREAENSDDGFPQVIWDQAVKAGWSGMIISEEFGGTGGSLLDACIMLEEVGRSGATVPLVTGSGLSAAILQGMPQSSKRDQWLQDIAGGKIISPALIGPESRNEWDTPQLPVLQTDAGFKISGEKVLVPFGASADGYIVTAIAESGEPAILLVDSNLAGVSSTRHHSGAGVPLALVHFKDSFVSEDSVVLPGNNGHDILQKALLTGALLSTAEAIGYSEAIKDMTAEYVSKRVAFGRPIGTFQAVAHPCADMHISNETIRMLTHEAAWRLDNNKDAVEEVMSTKALANELFERVANDAFCVHGAEGFYEGCDLQLFMRRIRSFCATLGETHETLERAALVIGM